MNEQTQNLLALEASFLTFQDLAAGPCTTARELLSLATHILRDWRDDWVDKDPEFSLDISELSELALEGLESRDVDHQWDYVQKLLSGLRRLAERASGRLRLAERAKLLTA